LIHREGKAAVKDELVRFSIAIGGELLRRFDDYRAEHRYPNRSEAVRGLMRAALVEEVVAHDDSPTLGVVTLIYDHHAGQVSERLTELQHEHLDRVVTTTHVHLDANRCLEVVLVRGPARVVRALADALIGTKGVETGRVVLAAADPLNGRAGHAHPHTHPHEHAHEHRHISPASRPTASRRAGRRKSKA
jgi:CopG family nickel-responsive transcriptional regulator